MAVSLNIPSSDAGNKIIVFAVKTQMEGGEPALPLLLKVGYTEEKALELIKMVEGAIIEEEKAESLKDLKDTLVESFNELGVDLVESGAIPDDIEVLSIDVKYYKEKTTLAGGQIVEPGFFVGMMKANITGIEKPVTLGRVAKKGTAGRKGNGSVPCPEGIDSWNAHLKAQYPDRAKELEGKSYSAPRELKALKDPTYLNAAAAAGKPVPETTETPETTE